MLPDWRMMPRVPTGAMLEAAEETGMIDDVGDHLGDLDRNYIEVWQAMFDAYQAAA